MNPNEHQLQYPWGDVQPEPGKAQAVADGVKWIRMPLPFALDHINLWLLRDELNGRQGWTIVDCGIARDEVKALWERVFEQELDGLPVLRVLVTHMHPDHVGLAHWLCERWNAELWMTMTDFMVASLWSSRRGGDGVAPAASRRWTISRATDWSTRLRRNRSASAPLLSRLVPAMPTRYTRILHGDQVRIGGRDWRVIVWAAMRPSMPRCTRPTCAC